MIKISKPFIEKNRLCVNVIDQEQKKLLWYEFEREYIKYLCTERLDGFVITLLLYAMKTGQDIICEEKLSEKLYYQISNFLIPTISNNLPIYKKINIKAELDNTILPSENRVGTGISLGVDSFYTLLSNLNNKTTNFNVTHLTCFNVGGNGSYGGEGARKLFNERNKIGRKFCMKNKFPFITVDSNISEIIMMDNLETHSFRQMAVPLFLQKLFSKYYYSSGYDFNSFKIDVHVAHYDLLNVHCFSTENIDFYSTGGEVSRIDKIKYISQFEITYPYLNVCTNQHNNCSQCKKCIRTMLELYSIDMLDYYKDSFDIDLFYKNLTKNLSDIIKYKNELYYLDILATMKKNDKKIPASAYIIGWLRRVKESIHSIRGHK